MSRGQEYADLVRDAGQSIDDNGGATCPLCGYWMKVAYGFECTGCGRSRGTTSDEIEDALAKLAEARGAGVSTDVDIGSDWPEGEPMDPDAVPLEPLPQIPGWPTGHPGASASFTGPTGSGRSAFFQACAYDAARHGIRTAIFSGELSPAEFNARARDIADRRGDVVDDALRDQLGLVRYFDLATVLPLAWANPGRWGAEMSGAFDVVAIDPLSAVAAALGLDFDKSNAEFVCFHEALVQPLVAAGLFVPMADNIGHDHEARNRAKGASAKQDRADLTFSCKPKGSPLALVITAGKVRSVRAPFRRGDSWIFARDDQRVRADESQHDGPFRPTALMQKVSQAIEASPGMTARDIRSVKGSNDWKKDALRFLIEEHYVRVEMDGKAQRHYSVKPYREADDTHRADVPNRADDVHAAHPDAVCADVPTPLKAHGTRHTSANGWHEATPEQEAELERIAAKEMA